MDLQRYKQDAEQTLNGANFIGGLNTHAKRVIELVSAYEALKVENIAHGLRNKLLESQEHEAEKRKHVLSIQVRELKQQLAAAKADVEKEKWEHVCTNRKLGFKEVDYEILERKHREVVYFRDLDKDKIAALETELAAEKARAQKLLKASTKIANAMDYGWSYLFWAEKEIHEEGRLQKTIDEVHASIIELYKAIAEYSAGNEPTKAEDFRQSDNGGNVADE